jgi:hypothetical protein
MLTCGGESYYYITTRALRRLFYTYCRSIEETEALVVGVERCGGGKWADIKKLGFGVIAGRSAVDLKDKWRNLMRVALLPAPGSAKCALPGFLFFETPLSTLKKPSARPPLRVLCAPRALCPAAFVTSLLHPAACVLTGMVRAQAHICACVCKS